MAKMLISKSFSMMLICIILICVTSLSCGNTTNSNEQHFDISDTSGLFEQSIIKMANIISFRYIMNYGDEYTVEGTSCKGSSKGKYIEAEQVMEYVMKYPMIYIIDPEIGIVDGSSIRYESNIFMMLQGPRIFPNKEIPIQFYNPSSIGIESIDGIQVNHMLLTVDFDGIVGWLKDNGKISTAASYYDMPPEEYEETFLNIKKHYYPNVQGPIPVEVWIDENGLIRRILYSTSGGSITIDFSNFSTQEIEIEVPGVNPT